MTVVSQSRAEELGCKPIIGANASTTRKLGVLSLCILTAVNVIWLCVYFDLHQATVQYFAPATFYSKATTQFVTKDLTWTASVDPVQRLLQPYHRLPFPVEMVTSDLPVARDAVAACKRGLRTLFFIHTSPTHSSHRAALRQYLGGFNHTLVFFVGLSADAAVRSNVSAEAKLHGDTVVLPYRDAYRNLTYKFVYGIKWTVDNCPDVKHVIKMDDDIVVNVYRLDAYLKDSSAQDAFHCLTWHRMGVVRDKNSPWYLSKEMYRKDRFPPYCSGSAMLLPTKKLRALYMASFFVPFISVDDAYVSGELALLANISHVEINKEFTLQGKWQKVARGEVIFAHFYREDNRLAAWKGMQEPAAEATTSVSVNVSSVARNRVRCSPSGPFQEACVG